MADDRRSMPPKTKVKHRMLVSDMVFLIASRAQVAATCRCLFALVQWGISGDGTAQSCCIGTHLEGSEGSPLLIPIGAWRAYPCANLEGRAPRSHARSPRNCRNSANVSILPGADLTTGAILPVRGRSCPARIGRNNVLRIVKWCGQPLSRALTQINGPSSRHREPRSS